MEHDTAEAILAWFNFTEGGAWNTIAHVDPSDIAKNIEKPVTWWPPGQYIPLGFLHSAGLSLGTSILILAFLATVLGSLGAAKLAEALGAPRGSLVWITAGVATSHHALIGFNVFLGGDSALMMITPWLIFAAWRLRNSGYILCLTLPLLFLLGTYIKHAFPMIAGAILLFLWAERISEDKEKGIKLSVRSIIHSGSPLLFSGLIYLLLRHLLFNFKGSPIQYTGQGYDFSFNTIVITASSNPTIATGNTEALLRIFKILLEKTEWNFEFIFYLIAPVALGSYVWLSTRRLPLLRLSGIVSLACVICIALLHFSGAAVDNGSRHFQILGMLLITCLAAQANTKGWRGQITKIVIISSIIAGGWTLARRSVTFQSFTYPIIQNLSAKILQDVFNRIQEVAMEPGEKLIAITEPIQAVYLHFITHSSTRFLYMTDMDRKLSKPHRGRVPRIIIPNPRDQLEANKQTRERLIDYHQDEWRLYGVGDWIFAEAGEAGLANPNINK